jgi:hypothetical protein
MMKSKISAWWAAFPYLLGAILFFFGAARFLVYDDFVGSVIYGAAGLLSLWQMIASHTGAKGKPGRV